MKRLVKLDGEDWLKLARHRLDHFAKVGTVSTSVVAPKRRPYSRTMCCLKSDGGGHRLQREPTDQRAVFASLEAACTRGRRRTRPFSLSMTGIQSVPFIMAQELLCCPFEVAPKGVARRNHRGSRSRLRQKQS
jgi:hypothetical protein